jgi:hypothetical protein
MPAIALLFGLLAIGTPASEAAADPRFAVATIDEGGTGCVCTRGWRLQVGDSLLVAQLDPLEILDAVVSGISDSCWADNQGVWGDSLSFHSIHIFAPRRSTETLRNFNPSARCVQPDLQRIVERVFGSVGR